MNVGGGVGFDMCVEEDESDGDVDVSIGRQRRMCKREREGELVGDVCPSFVRWLVLGWY